jgi:serine/threonine-protein kinase HipA
MMAKRRKTNSLFVGINGQHVGVFERSGGTHAFTYSDEWLSSEIAHPISLSMPLTKNRHTGDLVRYYFDNLLPDDVEIRKLIVDRVGAYSIDTMDLLSEIGRDCVGSLSLTSEPVNGIDDLKFEAMDEGDIATHLRNTAMRRTLGMDGDDVFRISIAGAQEKTALTLYEGNWYRPLGTTPTTHIFKLPINDLENGLKLTNSVDNEWFCLRFMHHLGFDVAQADIRTFEDQKALVVERFDRTWGEDGFLYRLTQEDMCQALGRAGQSKYEANGGPGAKEISELLRFSSQSAQDMYQFFLAQYAFWLLMGIDGHAKNFSVYLDHTGHWLTPLYDVISAHPFKAQFRRNQLKMAMKVLSKNSHYIWTDIHMRHWRNHATKTFLSEDVAMGYIAELNRNVENALDEAFSDAGKDFDQNTGNIIAESIMEKINR